MSTPSEELARFVAQGRLLAMFPEFAMMAIDPFTARYIRYHQGCERPPPLAWLCVCVGLAVLPPMQPNIEYHAVPKQALERAGFKVKAGNESHAILAIEAEWNQAILEWAPKLDRLLGVKGCGPHDWRPSTGKQVRQDSVGSRDAGER